LAVKFIENIHGDIQTTSHQKNFDGFVL